MNINFNYANVRSVSRLWLRLWLNLNPNLGPSNPIGLELIITALALGKSVSCCCLESTPLWVEGPTTDILRRPKKLNNKKFVNVRTKFSISQWPDGNPPANDDECALAVTQINLSIYHLPKIRWHWSGSVIGFMLPALPTLSCKSNNCV